MKKILSVLFLLLISVSLFAQYNNNLVDTWEGFIYRVDGNLTDAVSQPEFVRFQIARSGDTVSVTRLVWNSDSGQWVRRTYANSRVTAHQNNIVFSWIQSGGIWTETQVFMFSLTNRGLQLIHTRWVNNDDGNQNNTWGYTQAGVLTRVVN